MIPTIDPARYGHSSIRATASRSPGPPPQTQRDADGNASAASGRRPSMSRSRPSPGHPVRILRRSACCSVRRFRSPRRDSPSSIRPRAEYQQQYAAAGDATIEAGFVLEEDREALMDFADPSGIP
jgi:hypothetical protein